MKEVLIFVLVFSAIACSRNDYQDPPEFSAYEHNPVLVPGDSGSWDNLFIVSPCVVWHDHLFYLFYTGFNANGPMSIGLAISPDGYNFAKVSNKPVFSPDGRGFDAFGVGGQIVIWEDTCWVLYYNGLEIAGFGPGPFIGRCTSSGLSGPWKRSDLPILMTGSKGEWDSYYIFPTSLVITDDGTRMLFYSGGNRFDFSSKGFIGLAISTDGVTWKKYNNPETSQHPYAESDPVLLNGHDYEWDAHVIWTCNVMKNAGGYEAYYSGGLMEGTLEILSVGHAISRDGIHWKKFRNNPIFRVEDDPFSIKKYGGIEGPFVILHDSLYFMFFDYGTLVGCIGLATAPGR